MIKLNWNWQALVNMSYADSLGWLKIVMCAHFLNKGGLQQKLK